MTNEIRRPATFEELRLDYLAEHDKEFHKRKFCKLVSSVISTTKSHEEISSEIQKQTKSFLQHGGKVVKIENGVVTIDSSSPLDIKDTRIGKWQNMRTSTGIPIGKWQNREPT